MRANSLLSYDIQPNSRLQPSAILEIITSYSRSIKEKGIVSINSSDKKSRTVLSHGHGYGQEQQRSKVFFLTQN